MEEKSNYYPQHNVQLLFIDIFDNIRTHRLLAITVQWKYSVALVWQLVWETFVHIKELWEPRLRQSFLGPKHRKKWK